MLQLYVGELQAPRGTMPQLLGTSNCLVLGERRHSGNILVLWLAYKGFPDLLRQIAQDIVNERMMEKKGNGGRDITGPKESTANPRNRREKRLERQTLSSTPTSTTHIIGQNWVKRFLKRNSGFETVYIRYQERSRAAAINDIELQADFLRQPANLIRRKKIHHNDIWNCDEKGIIMGRNAMRTMAIVRAGGRSTAITEGSREFCSVLETISAAGVVTPPFIVWQDKTQQESYYHESGVKFEATFAVSPSGYMDDELGLEYIKPF